MRRSGKRSPVSAREPGGDGGIVGGGAGEGLGGEPAAQGLVGAPFLVQVPGQRRVVGGLGEDGDGFVVLGGGTDQGDAADVDLLDALGQAGAAGQGGLERVEVHHHEVDGGDQVLLEGGDVVGVVAAGEDAAVDGGVEGLHPAAQHLRGTGDLAHLGDGPAGGTERLGCAAGGDQLDIVGGERSGEVDEAGLVVDGEERAADRAEGHLSRGGARSRAMKKPSRPPEAGEVGGEGTDLAQGRQVDGQAAQLARLDRVALEAIGFEAGGDELGTLLGLERADGVDEGAAGPGQAGGGGEEAALGLGEAGHVLGLLGPGDVGVAADGAGGGAGGVEEDGVERLGALPFVGVGDHDLGPEVQPGEVAGQELGPARRALDRGDVGPGHAELGGLAAGGSTEVEDAAARGGRP